MKRMLRISVLVLCLMCLAALTGCPPRTSALVPGETRTFDGIVFQWCPAGTFTQGSPANEEGHLSNETAHQVTLSKGFWLGRYEVTQEQWEDVMGDTPSYFEDPDKPVEQVSWNDIQLFLTALNAGKGIGTTYRLPTEAEWEYAYRADTTTRFYWGEDSNEMAIDDNAWYSGNGSSKTHIVGNKLLNAWGLYDMSGNIHEWCNDRFGDYPVGPVTNPQGPSSGELRVARGGGWDKPPEDCRAARRFATDPNTRYFNSGFRLLRIQR